MIAPTALRLLLIDDDEDTFVLVRDFVRETAPDWSVVWAPTYELGVKELTTGQYDAALLDYHLGAQTGVDLLEAVRTMEHLPPIVLLTGQGDRAIDLVAMATGAADYLEKGALSPALLERTVRLAMERERAMAALRASEHQYHGLFDRAGDAVLVTDDDGRFVDVNPAAAELLGTPRDEILGRTLYDFVEPSADLPDVAVAWEAFRAAGEMRGQVRLKRPDGTIRDADYAATADFTPGRHLSILRDETERLADRTALVVAVDALRTSEVRFRSALDGVGVHALILDTHGRVLFVNRHLLARTGWTNDEIVGASVFTFLVPESGPEVSPGAFRDGMAAGPGTFVEHIESTWRTRSGGKVLIAWTNSAIRDDQGEIVAVAAVGEDVTARREAEATQARLVEAIGQAAESIIVMDIDGSVIYANPAFERMSGYSVPEVIGREPRTLFKGSSAAAAYPRMGRRLRSGRPWSGEFAVNRRDGTPYREEVTISPVRDGTGAIVNYVRVARDVTHLHAVQESLEVTTRERVAFAHALARLEQRDTPEETGQEITDAIGGLPGVDIAVLLSFEDTEDVRLLAVTSATNHQVPVGVLIPKSAAARLRSKAAAGAWTETRAQQEDELEYVGLWNQLDLTAVAFAPIGDDSGPIGVLALGTTDDAVGRRIDDQRPVAIEFAAAARSLIAAPLAARQLSRASRRRIEAIIAAEAFAPVFQPIVDLTSGVAIGFEALTRFTDGIRPDLVFAEAGLAGVGLELEAATLSGAIRAARELPAGPWLAVNVSAALAVDQARLGPILERRTRPIVLEITEHDAIENYDAVRSAIAALGPDVRIAVDDAGAGVANFGHIISLRPDFVKIDMGLVRGVNHDLTRQALIVGLGHFAQATNGWLIAEGVETDEERRTLIGLGLEIGQGYLFGRPATVEAWHTVPAADVPRPRGAIASTTWPTQPNDVGAPAAGSPPIRRARDASKGPADRRPVVRR